MFLAHDTPIGELTVGKEPGFWRDQLYHVVRPCRVPLGVYTPVELDTFAKEIQAIHDRDRAKREAHLEALRVVEAMKTPQQRQYEREKQEREEEAGKWRQQQDLFNEQFAASRARALEWLIAYQYCSSK